MYIHCMTSPRSGAEAHTYIRPTGPNILTSTEGMPVISIGHAHPHYVEAVSRQVAALGFYSNSVVNPLQEEFARRLGEVSGYPDFSLFMCNSGAEANENAVKLASFTTGRRRVLAVKGAFHGRTSGAVAMTDNPRLCSPFNETGNVDFIPFDDSANAAEALGTCEYAAVIVEGIQGVAGIHEPSLEFLKDLRRICDNTGTMLIVDEIQSGYGRTGRFFAHQHAGVRPDLVTCAKGIANGFPAAALLISPDIPAEKGMLGTTFGGNHLACAAALAVLDVMASESLIENARDVGAHIIESLQSMPGIADVRGRGLMIGFEAEGRSGAELRRSLLFNHHVFTGGAGERTVRLLPALNLSMEQADRFLDVLSGEIGI